VQTLANLIAGRQRRPIAGAYLPDFEPATGEEIARVPASDAQDVRAAVEAAAAAFPAWSSMPPAERSAHLLALADLIEANLDTLADAESTDTGKPVALARTVDIPRAVENFRFFATAILHTESAFHESHNANWHAINYTLRRPRGVAGLISPWNLPLYLLTWKIAPAIATGNTCVAKPSEVTPLTASMLGRLAIDAGLPPGVINIVHGTGADAGAPLVEHPDVPTISFTGSTGVGCWIGKTAGDMLKRVSLELGGKNPNVIFADADLDEAIDTAARAAFTNQGQICLCGSRVIVERGVYDRVVDGLVQHAESLTIGDPRDPATLFGALTSAAHRDKVASYVEMARELGGTIRCGGKAPTHLPDRCRAGSFFEPTVITDLPPGCRVLTEEIFGPVVTVEAFDTEDDAVTLANATDYGLASMLWTSDLTRAHRVAERIHAGIVWVNCWMLRDLRTPFGGVKQSGVGREGGLEALRFFTEPKNVCVRLS